MQFEPITSLGHPPLMPPRHELLARLGVGGMGEVFLAERRGEAGFRKLVVIKTLLPHLVHNQQIAQLFINEARVAARFTHPNVCAVYDFGQCDGRHYLTMEYLEGATLNELLKRRAKGTLSLDLPLIIGLFQQICEGLHYVHELKDERGAHLGILHRDVSPSNLFVTLDGIVKLLDFGIAKVTSAICTSAERSSIKGKFAYMSPEQLSSAPVDRRSDLFASGAVLYEMVTGRRLFARKSDAQVVQAVLSGEFPSPAAVRPGTPPALSRAISRALARDPADRFANVRQFCDAVVAAVPGALRVREIAEVIQPVLGDLVDERRSVLASPKANEPSGGTGTRSRAPGAGTLGPVSMNPLARSASTSHGSTTGRPFAEVATRRRAATIGALAVLSISALVAAAVVYLDCGGSSHGSISSAAVHPGRTRSAWHSGDSPDAGYRSRARSSAGRPMTPWRAGQPRRVRLARPSVNLGSRDRHEVLSRQHSARQTDASVRPSKVRVRRPRALRREPRRHGFISVDSAPSYAFVYVDGRRIGDTPLIKHRLSAGRHRLRVVLPDGRSRRRVVVVRPGAVALERIHW